MLINNLKIAGVAQLVEHDVANVVVDGSNPFARSFCANLFAQMYIAFFISIMEKQRWEQRFESFCKAIGRLQKYIEKGDLTELEEPGMIQTFEFTFELAWKTLKDFYAEQDGGSENGVPSIQGGKDAIRVAIKRGLIQDGKSWLEMLSDRNLSSHVYQEIFAAGLTQRIRSDYFPLFCKLRDTITNRENQDRDVFGFDEDDWELVRKAFQLCPEIESVVLYGSRATGRFHSGSDVDVALKGENLEFRHVLSVANYFSDSNSPFLFDVSLYKELDDAIKAEIDRNGLVIYSRA